MTLFGAVLVSDRDESCLGMGIRGFQAGRGFAMKGRREVGEARSREQVSFNREKCQRNLAAIGMAQYRGTSMGGKQFAAAIPVSGWLFPSGTLYLPSELGGKAVA